MQLTNPASSPTTLSLNGGAGNDTVNILSTPSVTTTFVDTGTGTGDGTAVGGGNLANVQGNVFANDSAGDGGTLRVDDSADSTQRTYTVGAGTITCGATPATIHYTHGASGLTALSVAGGSNNNTFQVTDTTVATTLTGGSGNDTFRVGNGANLIDGLAAPLFVQGGNNGAAGDALFVNDSGQTTGHVYAVTPAAVNRSGGPAIAYNGIENVTVDAGSGTDSFDVWPSASTPYFLDGGGPATQPGDQVTYHGSATVTPTGPRAGSITAPGLAPVQFANVEVIGSSGGSLTAFVSTANLGIGGDGAPDNLLLQASGPNFALSANGTYYFGGVTASYASLPIIGSSDADTLTVDFSNGNPIPTGGLSFDGGRGRNTLALQGGSFTNETYTPLAGTPGSGNIAFDNGGSVLAGIVFTNLQPINDTVAVVHAAIDDQRNTAGIGGPVNIVNAGAPVNGLTATQVNSGSGGGFELINLANKQNLTINGQGGSDTFTIDNAQPAAGLQSLTINGSNAGNIFAVAATGVNTVLNAGNGSNTVTLQNASNSLAGITGPLAINGGAGSTLLNATNNANITLSNGQLVSGATNATLTNIATANLTDSGTRITFDVSGWTGGGSLNGSGTDTVTASKNTDFTLSNGTLMTGDGLSLTLLGITTANLTGGPSANNFDVSQWTHGGTLTGGGELERKAGSADIADAD